MGGCSFLRLLVFLVCLFSSQLAWGQVVAPSSPPPPDAEGQPAAPFLFVPPGQADQAVDIEARM
jgi:hypothetical protein